VHHQHRLHHPTCTVPRKRQSRGVGRRCEGLRVVRREVHLGVTGVARGRVECMGLRTRKPAWRSGGWLRSARSVFCCACSACARCSRCITATLHGYHEEGRIFDALTAAPPSSPLTPRAGLFVSTFHIGHSRKKCQQLMPFKFTNLDAI
jgi:hypothetical protein